MPSNRGRWVKREHRPGSGPVQLMECLWTMYTLWHLGRDIGQWTLTLREWTPAKRKRGKGRL